MVLGVVFQREFQFIERVLQQHSAMVNLCEKNQQVGAAVAVKKIVDGSELPKQSFVDDLNFGFLFIGYPHYQLSNWFSSVSRPQALIYNCMEP